MKIIMSEKEMKILQETVIALADQPMTETPGIVSIRYQKTSRDDENTNVIIDINERYVVNVYGEANKWLPAICNATKGLIALCKSFIITLNEKEVSLLKELKAEKAL